MTALHERLQDVIADMRAHANNDRQAEYGEDDSVSISYVLGWADRLEAAQSLQAQEGDLLDALRTLHRLGQFDNVYDVRARADLSILRDDQSSWDHPDVIAYSEACKVIESYLAAALPLR